MTIVPDLTGVIDVTEPLRRHFGHAAFRPGQEDVVRAVVDGLDVLAVMPTGSGKSLGFQLPAVMLPGITIVVSPLIALMKDQVDELSRRGIAAAALHSMASSADRRDSAAARAHDEGSALKAMSDHDVHPYVGFLSEDQFSARTARHSRCCAAKRQTLPQTGAGVKVRRHHAPRWARSFGAASL
jgi:hypothetical protein